MRGYSPAVQRAVDDDMNDASTEELEAAARRYDWEVRMTRAHRLFADLVTRVCARKEEDAAAVKQAAAPKNVQIIAGALIELVGRNVQHRSNAHYGLHVTQCNQCQVGRQHEVQLVADIEAALNTLHWSVTP